jgi:hypothetical protein
VPDNVVYFNYLCSVKTNEARCTSEKKRRNYIEKVAFKKRKNLCTSKLKLNLTKKLIKCCIWSVPLCGVENWTLRRVVEKYLGSCEMWCWRGMENISWTDGVRNEEALYRFEQHPINNKNKIDYLYLSHCA